MKPTKPVKKKPAKRKPLHGESNPLVAKLLNLKYRLNDAYNLRDEDTKADKAWVMKLISEVRLHNFTKYKLVEMLINKYKDKKIQNLNVMEELAEDILVVLDKVGNKL